jgi:hypothetical protein
MPTIRRQSAGMLQWHHARSRTQLACAENTIQYYFHTFVMQVCALAACAHTCMATAGKAALPPTRCSCCLCCVPQAHSAQEVPLVEPVSHAVLQQSSSAQQASSALFGKEATPRHMQVPGTSRSHASKVIKGRYVRLLYDQTLFWHAACLNLSACTPNLKADVNSLLH